MLIQCFLLKCKLKLSATIQFFRVSHEKRQNDVIKLVFETMADELTAFGAIYRTPGAPFGPSIHNPITHLINYVGQ